MHKNASLVMLNAAVDKTWGWYICIYLSLVAPEANKSVAQAVLESKGSGSAISSTWCSVQDFAGPFMQGFGRVKPAKL